MLTSKLKRRQPRAQHQRGLSIVELMVGVAVGLIVVAGAVLLVTSQLSDNRRLLLETQIQQDLRATADIVTRELRRAGHWDTPEVGVWHASATPVLRNPYAAVTPASGASSEISFSYRRRHGDTGPYGFKLESGVIRSRIGTGWQELTDSRLVNVTGFTITLTDPQSYRLPCARLCAGGTQDCWPTLEMRTATVDITVQSKVDPAVVRSASSTTRLRNDRIRFNDPLFPDRICPI